ncbi:hypothetical protein TrRE_jg10484 [Triparma retinervis]|uniref:SSD domain-containing protein n=1 Tax=Triparma retinervis TaxID=2557542 RepID=A0A9W6ZQT7_9STRA|nr:hypothetical protein TrRE_jg10484 [Triparma retinervis]
MAQPQRSDIHAPRIFRGVATCYCASPLNLLTSSRNKLLDVLEGFFGGVGRRVSEQPKLTLLICFLFTIAAGTGIPSLYIETDNTYLWIPQNNIMWANFIFNRDTFGGQARDTLVLIEGKDGGDLLNHDSLSAIMDFHTAFTTTVAAPTGEIFQDLCFKTPNGCDASNFLVLWSYDAANIPADAAAILAQINGFAEILPTEITFGGLTYADNAMQPDPDNPTVISGAKSVRMHYKITNNDAAASNAWEKEFLDWTDPYVSEVIDVKRAAKRSFDDECVRLVQGDSPLFAGAILALTAVLACTFGKMNKVESRFLVTWAVLVEILFCLVFAFGMLGHCGFMMTNLNAMCPFIVAGVSVDDMIVIEDFFNKAEGKRNRMSEAMKAAGVAITITSVTTIVAFLSGCWCDMPAVRSFCLTCTFAFTWDFFLNISFFPALIVLDQRRIEAKKHFLCPCCITVTDFDVADEQVKMFLKNAMKDRKKIPKERRMSQYSRPAPFKRSSFVDIKAMRPDEHKPTGLEDFMDNTFAPFLTRPAVQAVVVIASLAVSGTFGYVSQFTPTGIDVPDALPDDSYITTYFEQTSEYWKGEDVRPLTIVMKDLDYTNAEKVGQMTDYFDWVETLSYTASNVGSSTGGWYKNYILYLQANGLDQYADFNAKLEEFLATDGGKTLASDVICATTEVSTCSSVKTSRFLVWNKSPSNTATLYDISKEMSDKLQTYEGLDAFVFTEQFLYAMTDSVMYNYILSNLKLTLSLVFVVMIVFTDNVSSFFITGMVFMIDLDLLGIMYLWGVNISSVSFVCLAMSVGLCVDYCVHIGHAFTHSHGDTPNKRLAEAVQMLGTSVVKGAGTTLLGTVVLAGASSLIFRTFFKMLFSIVAVGVMHGIVVLPVFLSVFYNIVEKVSKGGGGDFVERETRNSYFDNKRVSELGWAGIQVYEEAKLDPGKASGALEKKGDAEARL